MLLKSSLPTADARPHSRYFVRPKVTHGQCVNLLTVAEAVKRVVMSLTENWKVLCFGGFCDDHGRAVSSQQLRRKAVLPGRP